VLPCYIDEFYPEVGITALELLKKLGVGGEYPSRLLQHLPQMSRFFMSDRNPGDILSQPNGM